MKRKQVNCDCAAYLFRHRLDGGLCRDFYNHEDISEGYREGIARDFERSAAQAYNQERSIFEQTRNLT